MIEPPDLSQHPAARAADSGDAEPPPNGDPPEPTAPPPGRQPADWGTAEWVGQRINDDQGRIFPCPSCGADLVFHIGEQSLRCQYCGHVEAIAIPTDAAIVEQDLSEMLARLETWHDERQADSFDGMRELRCESCGGTVLFQGTLTSTHCPYCASPIQIDRAEQAKRRIAVDGLLPFFIERDKAADQLREWVSSRWFAPNDFRAQGIRADFNGVYLPFWTFDTMTFTRYTGQRGEVYFVTVGSGKNRRTETRVRWYPESGQFQRFFDDVLVNATRGLNQSLVRQLEPWPLEKCMAYNQAVLAGFLARTYDVALPAGFDQARSRIQAALEQDVRQRIGGDRQQITSMNVRHSAATFKHLLLPVWMMAYRYHDTAYRVYINATTGEVHGERPYSWVKIALATLTGLVSAGLAWLGFSG